MVLLLVRVWRPASRPLSPRAAGWGVFALEVTHVEFMAETFGFSLGGRSSMAARILQGDEVVRVASDLSFASQTDMWWVALLAPRRGMARKRRTWFVP